MTTMPRAQKLRTPPRLKVGETVEFPYGGGPATGLIIEDRGDLGFRGGQVIRVAVRTGWKNQVIRFEISADAATRVPPRAAPRPARRAKAGVGIARRAV
jgi:hypothetical protein